MIINTKYYKELMQQKGLDISAICYKTGLTEKSVKWIFANGYSSVDAQERLASAVDAPMSEIVKAESKSFTENVIEFSKDEETATLSLSQGRYKSRIRKLAQSHPEECEIVAENKDGSLCAHVPVEWIKINPARKLSDEARERLSKHAKKYFDACYSLDEKV